VMRPGDSVVLATAIGAGGEQTSQIVGIIVSRWSWLRRRLRWFLWPYGLSAAALALSLIARAVAEDQILMSSLVALVVVPVTAIVVVRQFRRSHPAPPGTLCRLYGFQAGATTGSKFVQAFLCVSNAVAVIAHINGSPSAALRGDVAVYSSPGGRICGVTVPAAPLARSFDASGRLDLPFRQKP
jgi:hypothetical protein